jgi:hypothetical protein
MRSAMTMGERRIQPLPLLSVGAVAAGWYLVSRVALRSLLFWLVPFIASFVIVQAGYPFHGAAVFAFGVISGIGAVIRHSGRVTSQWVESRWGHALVDEDSVWLGIVGRSFLATMAFGAVTAPVSIVGATAAPPLLALLGVLQIAFGIAAIGWAMSRVAATQLAAYGPVATQADATAAPAAPAIRIDVTEPPKREPAVAPAGGRNERSPAPRSSPAPGSRRAAARPSEGAPQAVGATAGEKLQCPKCKLYETERGAVIGWYCKICGWRESRG